MPRPEIPWGQEIFQRRLNFSEIVNLGRPGPGQLSIWFFAPPPVITFPHSRDEVWDEDGGFGPEDFCLSNCIWLWRWFLGAWFSWILAMADRNLIC